MGITTTRRHSTGILLTGVYKQIYRYFLFKGRQFGIFTSGYVMQHPNSHSEQLDPANIDKAI